MKIIEEDLIANSIGETIKSSLNALSKNINILERSYNLEVNEELLKEIIFDWVKLMLQLEQKLIEQQTSNFGFTGKKIFFSEALTTIQGFFDRYSEFFGQDVQIELNKFQNLCESIIQIIEGIEIIDNSQQNTDNLRFLEEIYDGIDLIVEVMETNASNLPIRLLSVMKIAFIQLPVKVDNIFHDYSPPGEKEQKLVKKYFRQIDRALNSGIAIINETLNIRQNQIAVSSEEERIEAFLFQKKHFVFIVCKIRNYANKNSTSFF